MEKWRAGLREGTEDTAVLAIWVQERPETDPVQYILPAGSTAADLVAEIAYRLPALSLDFHISVGGVPLPYDFSLQPTEEVLRVREGQEAGPLPTLSPPSIPSKDSQQWLGFHHIQLEQFAPAWRVIRKGLSLRAKCLNSACPAYLQNTYINRGFGTFSVEREFQIVKCPACGKKAERGAAMSVYEGKYKAEGMTRGEQDYSATGTTREGMMAVFLDKDKSEWGYLVIEVSELA